MKLTSRYDVIIDDIIKEDLLYVYYDNFPSEGLEVPTDSEFYDSIVHHGTEGSKILIILEHSPNIEQYLADTDIHLVVITKNRLWGIITIDN